MDLSALQTELNIRLSDTDNFAFTSDEKESALKESFKDPYAVKPVWDSSLTYSRGTFQYAKPAAVRTIRDIYIKASDDTNHYPEPIDSGLWEVVGDNIQFSERAARVIPDSRTLFLKGAYRYGTNETVAEDYLQEYILTTAQVKLYRTLRHKKLLKFVKNDTSIAEIVAAHREVEREWLQSRQRIQTEFENG